MPNLISKIFRIPDKQITETRAVGSVDLGFYSVSNSFISETNPTVNACINKISNTLGNIPVSVYVRMKGGGRTKAVFHPLFQAIKNPSIDYTPSLFWITLIRNLLYYGNAYLYVLRNSKNEILGFNLINPSSVIITRDSYNNKVFNFNDKQYSSRQILHIPYLDYDGTYGISPTRKLASLIDLDNKLFSFINSYFTNSIGNRIVIEPDESWKGKDIQEAYAVIAPLIKKFVTSSEQAGKPMIVPPATKMNKIEQSNNAESDLRSLKQLVERQICSGFSIPYSLINEDATKYDSAESKQLLFLSETIKPLGEHISQSFQNVLEPVDKDIIYLSYNYRSIIETDTEKLINYLSKEIGSGLLSVNEARALLELDAVGEEGNYQFIPANLVPLTQANIDAYMGAAKAKLVKSGIGDNLL